MRRIFSVVRGGAGFALCVAIGVGFLFFVILYVIFHKSPSKDATPAD